jgi:6-phosphogluconate dehydrogenase
VTTPPGGTAATPSAPRAIGLTGLATMGQNLALNLADHGYDVHVHNRTTSRMRDFVSGRVGDLPVTGHEDLAGLVAALPRPRVVISMVAAGAGTDAVLDELTPLLEPGDVVVDGGNAHVDDTRRRLADAEQRGLLYVGCGVSGGEEGARHGPSIMPGGSQGARELVEPVLRDIAARAEDGEPCCRWLGPDGAGHYVKMVHNGIEYGDMQVLAESYDLMRAAGMSNDEMAATFREWNGGRLRSYLVEISADVLSFRDPGRGGEATVDTILDSAGQKGTGRWTAISALEAGQPLTLVAEAVFARVLSSMTGERARAARVLGGPDRSIPAGELSTGDLADAVYAAKVVSYSQGFALLRAASEGNGWGLDLAGIARIWRAGCIIRAELLDDLARVLDEHDLGDGSDADEVLLAGSFPDALAAAGPGWRRVVAAAATHGIPVPALSSALAHYDGLRSERLPANLIQAQRDYFGAHTYHRLEDPDGEAVHTDWAAGRR